MFWRNWIKRKLKFPVNTTVRICSKEMIERTLNSENKLDGCLFMDQMAKYAGQEFKVLKFITNIYHKRMIRSDAPLYILEGLFCDGIVASFKNRCDRTCNFLWHEKWLEKR